MQVPNDFISPITFQCFRFFTYFLLWFQVTLVSAFVFGGSKPSLAGLNIYFACVIVLLCIGNILLVSTLLAFIYRIGISAITLYCILGNIMVAQGFRQDLGNWVCKKKNGCVKFWLATLAIHSFSMITFNVNKTSSKLWYMLYTFRKLSTLCSWLIIGEFWPTCKAVHKVSVNLQHLQGFLWIFCDFGYSTHFYLKASGFLGNETISWMLTLT